MSAFKRIAASVLERLVRPTTKLLIRHKPSAQSVDEWRRARFSWSQFGEDVVMHSILQISGNVSQSPLLPYYVDIGSYHPIQYSNTLYFRKLGWKGINVDPNPATIAEFDRLRSGDTNLCLAVGETSGKKELLIYNESGICGTSRLSDKTDATSKLGERPRRTLSAEVWRLDAILKKYLPPGTRIGFFDIDVEGSELEVLRSNDWNAYRPIVVAVEDHEPLGSPLNLYLQSLGYRMVGMCGFTKIFIESESWPLL